MAHVNQLSHHIITALRNLFLGATADPDWPDYSPELGGHIDRSRSPTHHRQQYQREPGGSSGGRPNPALHSSGRTGSNKTNGARRGSASEAHSNVQEQDFGEETGRFGTLPVSNVSYNNQEGLTERTLMNNMLLSHLSLTAGLAEYQPPRKPLRVTSVPLDKTTEVTASLVNMTKGAAAKSSNSQESNGEEGRVTDVPNNGRTRGAAAVDVTMDWVSY